MNSSNTWKAVFKVVLAAAMMLIVSNLCLQLIKAASIEAAGETHAEIELSMANPPTLPISITLSPLTSGMLQTEETEPRIAVIFPTGAVTEETVVTFTEELATFVGEKVDINRTFRLSATQQITPLTQFNKPVTVVVRYGEDDGELQELGLYRLSSTEWNTDGIVTIGQSADILTSTITQVGLYAVLGEPWQLYMPLVLKHWPPIPATPVLSPINNADGDNIYYVLWQAANLAETYILEEDDNAAFSSPIRRYEGAGTSWLAYGQPPGTYYYRVKAQNTWGESNWSNVQVVMVEPPKAIVYVANDTGGQLCYEIYNSGIGRRCFGPGEHLYGVFPAGNYGWRSSARCGNLEGNLNFLPGEWVHEFWCLPAGLSGSQSQHRQQPDSP